MEMEQSGTPPPPEPPPAAPPSMEPPSGHPVRLDIEYPEQLSRWLIFVKWLLVIPHLIILYLLQVGAYVATIIAFFSILFTRKYPKGLFDFVVNVNRWNANVGAYYLLFRDEYPPFTWEAGKYPVTFEVAHQEEYGRWLPLIKWLLVIPNLLVLLIVFIVAYVAWIIVFFAILFTARFPRGIFNFLVGVMRWSARANAYAYLLTDAYPPFSTRA